MSSNNSHAMDPKLKQAVASALGAIPSGLFILTAAHEDRRLGALVGWVQQVCFEPAMVSIAIQKGTPIMPLISESRQFGLCHLSADDRMLLRKFTQQNDPGEDPFLGMPLAKPTLTKLPIIASCRAYVECSLNCHMDVEGDHDIFVGQVVHAGFEPPFTPAVHLREDGFKY
jgi:flavin reductase (DIM6/NTAB) family NADH-FMN oxidoreductase RutF